MEHYVADFGTFVLEFTTEHGHLLGHAGASLQPQLPERKAWNSSCGLLEVLYITLVFGTSIPPQKK